jgi:RND family efflux transporter MFP subunit
MSKAIHRIYLPAVLAICLTLAGCKTKTENEEETAAGDKKSPTTIVLSSEAVKNAGIQTMEVRIMPIVRKIYAPGEIIFNPRKLAHVTARTPGRIECLLAYPGDKIQKGQLLLSFYSQDFLSLQAELIQATSRLKRLGDDAGERAAAQSFLNSVRNRLRLLDVTEEELAGVEKTGSLIPLLSIRAPLDGNIIESPVTAGDFVELGVHLFRIADLSTVWVDIHILEKDISRIRTGSDVSVRAAAFPGREFHGRLFQIGNIVDEKSRRLECRVELMNPGGELRPGMYVETEVVSPEEAKSLFVPASAVQDFQNKKIVFIPAGENIFSLREVEAGISINGFLEITKGLKEKESVVSGGSFFLKSELLKKSFGEEQP